MTGRDLKKEIQLCPLWNFISSDSQRCLALGEFCDIDTAEVWGSCRRFQELLKIFEEVLSMRDENEIETGTDAHEIKT